MMEEFLANTQELVPQESEEIKPEAWGRILPIVNHYPCVELVNKTYTVGRLGNIVVNPLCPFFNSISKVHFEIVKAPEVILLRDKSQNGTFVNGEKIGKEKATILKSNDEIALSCKMNKAFIFIDLRNKEQIYPPEVTRKYTIGKRIGSGACGEVKLAFKNDTYEKVAVKIIEKKTFLVANKSSNIESEVRILRQLNHPCIIKFEDAIDTKDHLYIFLEFVEGGELFDRVISIKQFRENEAKLLFYQMVVAIKYLHDNNVSHRDLKPENILLATSDNETLVKVTDFGLSKFVDGQTMLRTLCGTPNYLAPEVILSGGQTGYTFACDVWSLGVILFICLAGYPPFTEERTDYNLRDQITGCHIDFPVEHWAGITRKATSLIRLMLEVDPNKRIAINEILNHPWLDDNDVRCRAKKLMYPLADVSQQCANEDDSNNNDGDNHHQQQQQRLQHHTDDPILTEEPIIKKRKRD